MAGGVLLTQGLKFLYGRVRPEIVPHLMQEASASFPSGHSALSAVVYLTLGSILATPQRRPAVRVFIFSAALLVSLAVGATRVLLGVHYPSDVLAGWCVGIAWAALCWAAALLLGRRDAAAPEGAGTAGSFLDSRPRGGYRGTALASIIRRTLRSSIRHSFLVIVLTIAATAFFGWFAAGCA